MKIVYLCNIFPKLSETFILNQITSLIDRGHEVSIIAAQRSDVAKVHDSVSRYGLIAKTIYLSRNTSSLGFDVTEALVSQLVFADLIHAHFATEPASFAMKLSRLFSIPFAFTAHAYDMFVAPNSELLSEKIEHATGVITISEYNRAFLSSKVDQKHAAKIHVIRCGIPLDKFAYVERREKAHVTFLYVGRLTEKKGITYAIRAMSEVTKQLPSAVLRIIGEGELRADAEALSKELGLGNNIVFLGDQVTSVVRQEMETADVFVLPSVTASNGDREGIPIVLMEAQAMGLPVVSTSHSGIPELICDEKSGFLVPERDVTALAKRMLELASDPALRKRMGIAGRGFVEAHHDHAMEITKLELFMVELLRDRPLVSQLPVEQRILLQRRWKDVADFLIENRGEQLRKLNESVTQYDNRLKRLDEAIRLIGDLKQREDYITTLKAELSSHRALIQRNEVLLKEKIEKIDALTQQVVGSETELKDLRERVSDIAGKLASQSEAAQGLQVELGKRDERIKFMQIDIQRKQEELSVLRKWLGDITSSFPYRVFKKLVVPLRDVLLKNAGKKGVSGLPAQHVEGSRDCLAYLPDWSRTNPYQEMLYRELSKAGVASFGMLGKHFTFLWLIRKMFIVKVLHLHWLVGVYDPHQTGTTLRGATIFCLKLVLARLLGYRIFWTVHNTLSHESDNHRLELAVRKFTAWGATVIIVHCQNAKEQICRLLHIPMRFVRVIPHGSYRGYYPNESSRSNSRNLLGLRTDRFTFLYFGMIRKYKGIENLLETFERLAASHDVHLVIAGNPHDEELCQFIIQKTSNIQITSVLRYIPVEDVQHFFNACDIVVLPYKNILTSGAALLAYTFGKPVIMPNQGCASEIVAENRGLLYETEQELGKAMENAIELVKAGKFRDGPLHYADENQWSVVVQKYYVDLCLSRVRNETGN